MMPEDRLRSALQRLVPPPDEQAGWQQVNRRMVRAHRARAAVVSVAAVMALGLGAAVVGAVQHDGTQHLDLASPHQTTEFRTTGPVATTGPSFPGGTPGTSMPGGGSSIPGGGTSGTGGTGSTDPSTPVSTGGGGSHPASTVGSGPAPTSPVQGATTVPGGHGGPSVTTPTSSPTTGGPTTTLATVATPDTTADVALNEAAVQNQVEDYLAPFGNQVHDVTPTRLSTSAAAGGSQWRIQVALRADATSLAADLLQRFPGHVVVTVGFFPYPSGPTPGAACSSSAPAAGLPNTVSATAKVPPVSRGADFTGTITITNRIAVPMPIAGSTTVDLLLPGSNTVVATYDGTAGNRASSTTLGLGASTDLAITGGTASCTGLGGYALPPGTYDGRVRVTVNGSPAEFRFPVTVV